MNSGRVFLTGVVGALAMAIALAAIRAMDLPLNLGLLLGTMTGLEPSQTTWMIGMAMHLALGGVFAYAYAFAFESLTDGAGPILGVAFGVFHGMIAGVLLLALPYVHPGMPEAVRVPGPFMATFGPAGVLAFMFVHMLYGGIVGVLYPPLQKPAPLDHPAT
jgi:hypothetical protein